MKNIASALSKFHELVPDIKKGSTNPFFNSKYAGLDAILPVIQEPLKQAGLTFTQIPSGLNKLKTIIIHIESGETVEGELEITPARQDPQGQGSALTYMRRYALVAMLGLNTEEDDDGNASIKPQAKTRVSKATPASKTPPSPKSEAEDPLKEEIKAKMLLIDPGLAGKSFETWNGAVWGRTQLKLIPENYNAILDKLNSTHSADIKSRMLNEHPELK